MSASWHSELKSRRRARRPAAALLAAWAGLAVLLLAATSALARTGAAAGDSTGPIRRIQISDRGIFVDRGRAADSVIEASGDVRDRVRDRARGRVRDRISSGGGVIVVDDEGTGIVRIWSDAFVPAGTVVDGDVVAVFGSVTVEGEVAGDVVAVFGSVDLRRGAKADGDVVSIWGAIKQDEGVSVSGDTVQIGFSPLTWGLPGVSVLLFAVAAGWLVSMFVGWIFSLLFPTGMLRVATVVERRPAASFFLGILSLPMFLLTMILLFITIIGIPVGILLPMVYVLMGYAGQLAATCVLGARLTRRPLGEGLVMPLLFGSLFVAALLAVGAGLMIGGGPARSAGLFLTLLGGLLLLGLGTLGSGAFLLSRFGTRPADVMWQGRPVVAPGAVPQSSAG